MMRTIYLKTDTEQEMIDILSNYRFYDQGWKSISYYNDRRADIDVVGVIVRMLSETEAETLPGFHVNLLWPHDEIPQDIQDITITPSSPERIFFGV